MTTTTTQQQQSVRSPSLLTCIQEHRPRPEKERLPLVGFLVLMALMAVVCTGAKSTVKSEKKKEQEEAALKVTISKDVIKFSDFIRNLEDEKRHRHEIAGNYYKARGKS